MLYSMKIPLYVFHAPVLEKPISEAICEFHRKIAYEQVQQMHHYIYKHSQKQMGDSPECPSCHHAFFHHYVHFIGNLHMNQMGDSPGCPSCHHAFFHPKCPICSPLCGNLLLFSQNNPFSKGCIGTAWCLQADIPKFASLSARKHARHAKRFTRFHTAHS